MIEGYRRGFREAGLGGCRVFVLLVFLFLFFFFLFSQLSVSVARDKKVKFGQRLFVGPRARLCFNSPFEHLLGNAPSS